MGIASKEGIPGGILGGSVPRGRHYALTVFFLKRNESFRIDSKRISILIRRDRLGRMTPKAHSRPID